jgi:molybdopterin synthase catalytic subunit
MSNIHPTDPSSTDVISLQAEPLDIPAAIAQVGDNDAGGIAIFLGTTRAEIDPSGRALVALDYQAYDQMALRQMQDLVTEARKKWPIRRAALLHRTARVEVGEPSVLVAISCGHRAEAFDACRYVIDQLKAVATIWKKEIWQDGSATWVHPQNELK